MHREFTGRHTSIGIVLLLCGLAALFLVPASFTLTGRGWLVGVLLFLPVASYLLFEAVRRLSRMTIVFSDSGVELRGRFCGRTMSWGGVKRIRAQQEMDDEARIIVTLYDQERGRISIPQGTFSIPALDEMMGILKEQVTLHPEIEVEDADGIWSSWDDFVDSYRKVRPQLWRE